MLPTNERPSHVNKTEEDSACAVTCKHVVSFNWRGYSYRIKSDEIRSLHHARDGQNIELPLHPSPLILESLITRFPSFYGTRRFTVAFT